MPVHTGLLVGRPADKGFQVHSVKESRSDSALDFQIGKGTRRSVSDQGEENKSDHGDADLSHQRVEGGAQKGFDLEMLFDPFEEQLHFPPALIQSRDGACGPLEVVGEEHIHFAILRVDVPDSPQLAGIFLVSERFRHADDVIGRDAPPSGGVDRAAFKDFIASIRFQPCHEESPRLVHGMKQGEIGVGSVNQKDAVFLGRIPTGHVHVVRLAVGHDKSGGNRIPVVIVDVKFYGPFGLSKPGPIKDTQTKLDGCGVPGTQLVTDTDGIAPFQSFELLHHRVEQLHVDLPRSLFIGVSERGTMNL